jgi:20S proteasome subunit beta 3
MQKVFEIDPHTWVGLPGLATDTQTVLQKIKFRTNMYELREGKKMKATTFAAMLSNMLYERRFGPYFVEPIVAGLDPVSKQSFICAMDLIGNRTEPVDFVVSGTAEEQLYGELRLIKDCSQASQMFLEILTPSTFRRA